MKVGELMSQAADGRYLLAAYTGGETAYVFASTCLGPVVLNGPSRTRPLADYGNIERDLTGAGKARRAAFMAIIWDNNCHIV